MPASARSDTGGSRDSGHVKSEHSNIVHMTNWREQVTLLRTLLTLDRTSKAASTAVTIEQKGINRHFRRKVQQTRLTYARLTGDRDKARELRARTTGLLNTNVGETSDADMEVLRAVWKAGRRQRYLMEVENEREARKKASAWLMASEGGESSNTSSTKLKVDIDIPVGDFANDGGYGKDDDVFIADKKSSRTPLSSRSPIVNPKNQVSSQAAATAGAGEQVETPFSEYNDSGSTTSPIRSTVPDSRLSIIGDTDPTANAKSTSSMSQTRRGTKSVAIDASNNDSLLGAMKKTAPSRLDTGRKSVSFAMVNGSRSTAEQATARQQPPAVSDISNQALTVSQNQQQPAESSAMAGKGSTEENTMASQVKSSGLPPPDVSYLPLTTLDTDEEGENKVNDRAIKVTPSSPTRSRQSSSLSSSRRNSARRPSALTPQHSISLPMSRQSARPSLSDIRRAQSAHSERQASRLSEFYASIAPFKNAMATEQDYYYKAVDESARASRLGAYSDLRLDLLDDYNPREIGDLTVVNLTSRDVVM